MSLCFGVKVLCDLSIYFIYAQLFCAALGAPMDARLPLLVLALAAGLSHALRKKGGARWLPLLALPVCLLWLPGWPGALLLVVPALYLLATVKRGLYYMEHGTCSDNFRRGLFILLPIPLLGLFFGFFGAGEVMARYALPMAVLYLACGVWLLRMLRHDPRRLSEPRFILINAGVLLAVLAAAALLSSSAALGAMKSGLGFVYRYVITPPLLLLGYLAAGLIWLLGKALALIGLHRGVENQEESEILLDNTAPLFEDVPLAEPSEVLKAVLMTLFIAVCIFIAWRVIRRMLGYDHGVEGTQSVRQTRGEAEKSRPEERPPLLRPRESRACVRYYYRKFLLLCGRLGIGLPIGATSETVAVWAAQSLPDGPVRRLRELYIRARYSGGEIPRDMADEAGELYRELKKEMPKLPK